MSPTRKLILLITGFAGLILLVAAYRIHQASQSLHARHDYTRRGHDVDRAAGNSLYTEFLREGVVGPFPSGISLELSTSAVDKVEAQAEWVQATQKISGHETLATNSKLFGETHIYKKRCFAFRPACRAVGSNEAVISVVRQVLATDNVVLWSQDLFVQTLAEPHPWHLDGEAYHICEQCACVWLALEDVNGGHSLQVMTRSHRMSLSENVLQRTQVHSNTGETSDGTPEEDLLHLAQRYDPASHIHNFTDLGSGQFVVLHGRTWHRMGKSIATTSTTRSLRMCYTAATSDCRVYGFQRPQTGPWPLTAARVAAPARPPVQLVHGDLPPLPYSNFLGFFDESNVLLESEAVFVDRMKRAQKKNMTATETLRVWYPLRERPLRTFATRQGVTVPREKVQIGNAATPTLAQLEMFVVNLPPNNLVHKIERHRREEFICAINGSHEIFLHCHNGSVLDMITLTAGSWLYIPPYCTHTQLAGPAGASLLNINFTPWRALRDQFFLTRTTSIYDPSYLPVNVFLPAPEKAILEQDSVLMDGPSMAMSRLTLTLGRCLRNFGSHATRDVLLYIEQGAARLLPNRTKLEHGAVLFVPTGTMYGIEPVASAPPARCYVVEFYL